MPTVHPLTWQSCGTMEKPDVSRLGPSRGVYGVYVFVFDNGSSPRRIVYVGTAEAFEDRWKQHRCAFFNGERTIWKPDSVEDIYRLMSSKGKGDREREDFYKGLIEAEKVWIPKWPAEHGSFKEFLESDWPHYVKDRYLELLRIWACEVKKEPPKLLEILESRIQRALSDRLHISWYEPSSRRTWLGQQEITELGQLREHEFRFDDLPDVDDESAKVLRALPIDSDRAP